MQTTLSGVAKYMSELQVAAVSPVIKVSYQLIHLTTGRIRFRIPRLKIDEEFTSKLQWTLKSKAPIFNVRVNPIISCLIVHYVPDQIDCAGVQAHLKDAIAQALRKDLPLPPQLPELKAQTEIGSLEPLKLPVLSLGAAIITAILELPSAFLVGGLILIAAIPLFQSTVDEITEEQKLTSDILESLWTLLHVFEGFLIAPALALSLDGLGKILRDRTASHIDYQAINLKLQERYTHVKRAGKQKKVLIKNVETGDLVIVYPGERIPVDGVVVKGKAIIDQLKLTGSSKVLVRREGQKVYASTLVVEGKLTIQAEKTGDNTQVGKLLDLVKQAPVQDTRLADFAEDVADLTTVPILALSGLLFAFTNDIQRALALLQLDFATGIRISSATAILSAIDYAARHGVYIRSGRALEMLARVDTVVFDKTGTLTQIQAEVVNIQTINEQITFLEVLSLAAAAEQGLSHPSAKAIVNYAEKQGVMTQIEWESWDYKIGRGVIAQLNGQRILLGSKKFLRKEGIDFRPMHRQYPDIKNDGHTHIYLARDQQLLGVISLSNPIRPESASVISALKQQQIQPYMLTGDNAKAANAVAREVGISPNHTYVEVFPEKKVDILRKLDQEDRIVAYVGDGLNDAAGLAFADVSVSFAEGSQTARQAADIVMMNNDLHELLMAISIAKDTMTVVYQNIGLVAVPNVSVVLAGVLLSLDPIMVVVINSGFTILAELNGLRPLAGSIEPKFRTLHI
ncbi:MAG: heavy metal translocating P-type ATPase [Nodularia sp. (in: Bacteria)]|nr:MAG: heavy metal translocating P-type ATPase [Nodularia sp. (in: cyanobacteria)]